MAPTESYYASTSAPLPSPSANEKQSGQYFPSQQRQRASSSIPQTQAQAPTSQPQQQPQKFQLQQNPQQYAQDPYATGKEKDFCMVAEAAKRAQMAVLMRDMGEVGL